MARRGRRSDGEPNGNGTANDGNNDVAIPDAPALEASNTAPSKASQEQTQSANGQSNKRRKLDAPETPNLETTVINGVTYRIQPEGSAKILLPDQAKEKNTEVFYNYIQQFNRDLTMAVTRGFADILTSERKQKTRTRRSGIKHKKKRIKLDEEALAETEVVEEEEEEVDDGVQIQIDPAGDTGMVDVPPPGTTTSDQNPKARFAILDALSATGLRALRYAKEIPHATHITANDMSYSAVEYIRRNIQFNEVGHLITANHDNAIGHMYRTAYPAYVSAPTPENPERMKATHPLKYHVIDLDPYGTASPFIDSAVQAVEDGGLLSVTCTDAAIFASTSYPEKTFATYGGLPAKGDFSHESGLRMVLMTIATAAARVFVRVRRGPEHVKKLSSQSMIIVNCDSGCGAWKVQELGTMRERPGKSDPANPAYKYGIAQAVDSGSCEFCGFKMHVVGPMWSDPIHSAKFINHMLSNGLEDDLVKSYGTIGRVRGMLQIALGELMPPPPSPPKGEESEEAPLPEANPVKEIPIPAPAPAVIITETPVPGQAPVIESTAPTEPVLTEQPANKQFSREKRKFRQRLGKQPSNLPLSKNNPTFDPMALFVMPTQLSRVLHCEAPSLAAIRGALIILGYHVTKSHCRPGSLKTNAPWDVIWRIMRAWVKKHPIRKDSLKKEMAGYKILYDLTTGEMLEDETGKNFKDIVFDEALGKEREKDKGVINYQMNPNAYWGPMAKAGKKGLTAQELSRVSNAEKDKRKREEKERRIKEGLVRGPEEGPEVESKRSRRKNKNHDGEKAATSELSWDKIAKMPPGTLPEQVDNPKKTTEETPVRTKESDPYSMGPIGPSDLERLEAEARGQHK